MASRPDCEDGACGRRRKYGVNNRECRLFDRGELAPATDSGLWLEISEDCCRQEIKTRNPRNEYRAQENSLILGAEKKNGGRAALV